MMARYIKIYQYQNIDESIEEYEFHEYDPDTATNLNNIRTSIES